MEKRLILAREAGKKTSKLAAERERVESQAGRLSEEREAKIRTKSFEYSCANGVPQWL